MPKTNDEMYEKAYKWLLRFLYAILIIAPVVGFAEWKIYNQGFPNVAAPMLIAILLIFLIKQGKSMKEFKEKYENK